MNHQTPPNNLEAEQAVLGSILLDNTVIPKVVEVINNPDFFYNSRHKRIFQTVLALYKNGKPVDIVTITNALRDSKGLEDAGGTTYPIELIESVPTTSNVEYYVKIVEESYVLRNIISTGSKMVGMGFNRQDESEQILEQAQGMIFEIIRNRVKTSFLELKDVLLPTLDQIGNSSADSITGVPSGFGDLDRITSGFQDSDLIILAARPSMGKTALALNIAANAAINHKTPVAIFSLEMSKKQLANRLLCSESQIDFNRLRANKLGGSDYKTLSKAIATLSKAKIFIDDTATLSTIEMKAKMQQLIISENIGLMIVDYLQLMQGAKRPENRTQEVSEISRSLKALAKELDIPIIALSQLSRGVEQRIDKIPRLSDLRESGEIEQTADIVMFIHRDDYYNEKKDNCEASLIISKHRNGPIGKVPLIFKREITKFLPGIVSSGTVSNNACKTAINKPKARADIDN